MKRLCAGVVAWLVAVTAPAQAAEITRIATSFEPDDPFGMYLEATYVRDQRKAKIVRERYQESPHPDVHEVGELRYLRIENRLDLDLRVGLWTDLEFRFTLPVIFSRDERWDFSSGTTAANSTLINNCLQADGGLYDPTCADTQAGSRPVFEVPSASYRGGLGNMRFGLAYALFNERKDPSKPMWLVAVDYEAPTAGLRDPTTQTARDNRGEVGDKIHRYTFSTAFSKRRGIADPYFRVHYTLPYRAPGWYSNCDNPDPAIMAVPENCRTGIWTRSETGITPPHSGGVVLGSEFVPYENGLHQKLALDVRLLANYVGPGRYYNELSDAMGKLLYTSDYLEVGGALGVTAWAAEFLGLMVTGALTYNTDRTLTGEQIGQDIDGGGVVNLDRQEELNPTFDHRVDMGSRRLRAAESFNFRIDAKIVFNF